MAARVRATPSSTSSRQSQVGLPALEKLQFPLNDKTITDLNLLARKLDISKLQHYQKLALDKISESASEINDRLVTRSAEVEKRRERRSEKGKTSGKIDAEEAAAIETLTERVKDLTGRLEVEVRKVIDAQAHLAARQTILEDIGSKARESSESKTVPSATQSTLGASQFRSQRLPNNREESGGDEAGFVSATALLESTAKNEQSTYQAMTMRQKYAHHNDYVNFKRLVHDAQHPEEDAPPLPHANTWFQDTDDMEGASELMETNAAGEALSEESDLEAVSERISTKCPITLRDFVEPVTTKCKHTFEKSAIVEMISQSNLLRDGTPFSLQQIKRGLAIGVRDRAVKCPVCTKLVAYADLRDDPIMVRRIKRAKAAESRHSDGEDDDDLVVSSKKKRSRTSQLAHTIPSDDAEEDDEEPATRIKRRQSEMPATQDELSDIEG